jgi:hypothetical protein
MITIFQTTEAILRENRKDVDRGLVTLQDEMEHEHTLLPDTPNTRLQRALKVYRGIRPVLTVLSTLPILPTLWRTGLTVLTQVLDALAAPEVTAAFKAGKDLEPIA